MILLNLLWGCVIFVVLFCVTFGSYCMSNRRTRMEGRAKDAGLIVSLGNCFACGIFLSSCFLGLFPHIREQEKRIRKLWAIKAGHSDSSSLIFLNSELVVLIGFLLMLLLEQIVHIFHQSHYSGVLEYSTEVKRRSANNKAPENFIDTTASSTCSSDLTTLLKCDEDTELLITDNPRTEDFDSQTDNLLTVKTVRFNDEVIQKHNPDRHFHSDLLSSGISLSTFVLLFGILTHSVFEGIALGSTLFSTEFYSLLIAIMIHEILCSFALGISLAQQKTIPKNAIISSIALASGIPIGMSSTIVINFMETFIAILIRYVLEGFAAGTFIYVACIELLSSELKVHDYYTRQGLYKALAVTTGVLTFLLVNITFGQDSHSSHSLFQPSAEIETISVVPSMKTVHL